MTPTSKKNKSSSSFQISMYSNHLIAIFALSAAPLLVSGQFVEATAKASPSVPTTSSCNTRPSGQTFIGLVAPNSLAASNHMCQVATMTGPAGNINVLFSTTCTDCSGDEVSLAPPALQALTGSTTINNTDVTWNIPSQLSKRDIGEENFINLRRRMKRQFADLIKNQLAGTDLTVPAQIIRQFVANAAQQQQKPQQQGSPEIDYDQILTPLATMFNNFMKQTQSSSSNSTRI